MNDSERIINELNEICQPVKRRIRIIMFDNILIILSALAIAYILYLGLGKALDTPDTLASFEGVDRAEVVSRSHVQSGAVVHDCN